MNIRTTFVLVMFLSVVAGYFLLADFRGTAAEPTAPWFYTANMDDIQRIRFETSDGLIKFFQEEVQEANVNRNPNEPKQITRIWRFDDEFAIPVDIARWGGITLLLSGPQSRRALLRNLEHPERYGLEKPHLTVNVDLTGDREIRVHLGDKTPDSLNFYIVQEGNPGLYLIDSTWGDVLSKLTKDPPNPKWFYRLPPDKVLFLKIAHQGQEVAFRRERFIGEPDRWLFSGKDGKPVAQERWKAEVQPILGGPPNLKLLRRGIDDPAKYGLAAPSTVVHVEYEPPFQPQPDDPEPELRRELDLLIGSSLPDGSGYYAQPKDQEYLVFVDKAWYDVLTGLATTPPVPAESAEPAKASSGG